VRSIHRSPATLAHGASIRVRGAFLRVRRGATSFAPTAHPTISLRARRAGFMRLAGRSSANGIEKPADLTEEIFEPEVSDPAIHLALTACPFNSARFVRERFKAGVFFGVVLRGYGHRFWTAIGLRFDRLVRRERVWIRFLQRMHRPRQRPCTRPGSGLGRLPPQYRLQRPPAS